MEAIGAAKGEKLKITRRSERDPCERRALKGKPRTKERIVKLSTTETAIWN